MSCSFVWMLNPKPKVTKSKLVHLAIKLIPGRRCDDCLFPTKSKDVCYPKQSRRLVQTCTHPPFVPVFGFCFKQRLSFRMESIARNRNHGRKISKSSIPKLLAKEAVIVNLINQSLI